MRDKDELVAFLNERKAKQRLIKELVFFCHGIINIASFHYASDERLEQGHFSAAEIKAVRESIFDYDAKLVTYACRAGISVGGDDLTGKNAGQRQSPAQKMADTWDMEVSAFEMRSSYVGIYGTGKEIKQAGGYGAVMKQYNKELSDYELKREQGETDIEPPVKPDNYEEMVRRYKDLIAREENENFGGPIAPNGAWRFPSTGDTPAGLKKGLQLYQPTEWKEK